MDHTFSLAVLISVYRKCLLLPQHPGFFFQKCISVFMYGNKCKSTLCPTCFLRLLSFIFCCNFILDLKENAGKQILIQMGRIISSHEQQFVNGSVEQWLPNKIVLHSTLGLLSTGSRDHCLTTQHSFALCSGERLLWLPDRGDGL